LIFLVVILLVLIMFGLGHKKSGLTISASEVFDNLYKQISKSALTSVYTYSCLYKKCRIFWHKN